MAMPSPLDVALTAAGGVGAAPSVTLRNPGIVEHFSVPLATLRQLVDAHVDRDATLEPTPAQGPLWAAVSKLHEEPSVRILLFFYARMLGRSSLNDNPN
jgi:hypothetical protein